MQNDEITNFLVVRHHAAVVFPNQRRVAVTVRKVSQEKIHPTGNHVYGCRLQRFDETGGQADRKAIMLPQFSAMPRGERDDAGILEGSPSQAAHERRFRSGVAAEPARVDIALAHAILQGYLPAPSRGLSRGTRRGKQRFLAGRLGHDGAIARQIIRPVNGTDAERLADQKSLETRAVDKKVTLNFSAIGKGHASDETVVPLHHPCHFAPYALESVRFG